MKVAGNQKGCLGATAWRMAMNPALARYAGCAEMVELFVPGQHTGHEQEASIRRLLDSDMAETGRCLLSQVNRLLNRADSAAETIFMSVLSLARASERTDVRAEGGERGVPGSAGLSWTGSAPAPMMVGRTLPAGEFITPTRRAA